MKRLFNLAVEIVLFCVLTASPAFSLEVAPRLTDREIIESLAELKQGQRDINKRFGDVNKRIDDQRIDINKRFGDVNNRIDDQRTDINKRFEGINKRVDDLRLDMNKRFFEMRQDINKRFSEMRQDMNKRMDTLHQTMLALFGTLITLIVALFGYIAWDRRTLVKPLQEKLNILEYNQVRETQNQQESTSQLKNLLDALRELAQKDGKLAAVLRSFALL